MILNKTTKWSIDHQHSGINFKIRHLMIAHVRGVFKTFDASIYITNNDFTTAEIDLWIDAASIDTGNAERDKHLRGMDFFDVANHPQLNFTSSTIGKQNENGKHELWGELTIKGVTKFIKLEVEFGGTVTDPRGKQRSGFQVDGKVNRSDWGIIFNSPLEEGGFLMGEEVTISCEMELVNENPDELTMELDKTETSKTVSKAGTNHTQ